MFKRGCKSSGKHCFIYWNQASWNETLEVNKTFCVARLKEEGGRGGEAATGCGHPGVALLKHSSMRIFSHALALTYKHWETLDYSNPGTVGYLGLHDQRQTGFNN